MTICQILGFNAHGGRTNQQQAPQPRRCWGALRQADAPTPLSDCVPSLIPPWLCPAKLREHAQICLRGTELLPFWHSWPAGSSRMAATKQKDPMRPRSLALIAGLAIFTVSLTACNAEPATITPGPSSSSSSPQTQDGNASTAPALGARSDSSATTEEVLSNARAAIGAAISDDAWVETQGGFQGSDDGRCEYDSSEWALAPVSSATTFDLIKNTLAEQLGRDGTWTLVEQDQDFADDWSVEFASVTGGTFTAERESAVLTMSIEDVPC